MKNDRLINVVNVIGSPINGGVQNFILALSNYDKNFNIKRHIICLYSNCGSLKQKFIDQNINIYFCPLIANDRGFKPYFFWKKVRQMIGYLFFIIKLFIIIRKSNAKIVFCHEPANIIEQLFVSKLLAIPFVNHMHKEFNYFENFKFFKYIYKNINFISDSEALITSNLNNLRLESKWVKKIPLITATGDLEKFSLSKKLNHKNKIIQIGSVGRFNWEKNFELLIKICKKLKESTKFEFQITIVGDGPDFDKISEMIKKNKLEKLIYLKGELSNDEVKDFMSNLDIYLQTSLSEGSPLTIKEAMVTPLVVISSNVGGVSNLIKNNINGFLVYKINSDFFVETIMKVLKMRENEINKIKKSANKFIMANFSSSRIASKIFNYISEKIS